MYTILIGKYNFNTLNIDYCNGG